MAVCLNVAFLGSVNCTHFLPPCFPTSTMIDVSDKLPGCVSFPSPSSPHLHCPRTVARLCVFTFSFKSTSTLSTYSCPVVCLSLLLQGHIYTVHVQLPGCVSFPSPSSPHLHRPLTVARLCAFTFSFKSTSTLSTYSCPVMCLYLLLQVHIYTVHVQLLRSSFPFSSPPHPSSSLFSHHILHPFS